MISLFLDTSSKKLEVILVKDNEVLSKKELESINDHASHLVPFIDEVLKENSMTTKDINKVFVVNGPGSFTGIRIGLSTLKAFSFVDNKKIFSLSSSDLLTYVAYINSEYYTTKQKRLQAINT